MIVIEKKNERPTNKKRNLSVSPIDNQNNKKNISSSYQAQKKNKTSMASFVTTTKKSTILPKQIEKSSSTSEVSNNKEI